MDTAIATEARTIVVKNIVCHGDYREEFYGSGATILEAAADAARQSTYSADLFDISDRLYEGRSGYRDELHEKLSNREAYMGFGWNTFTRIG